MRFRFRLESALRFFTLEERQRMRDVARSMKRAEDIREEIGRRRAGIQAVLSRQAGADAQKWAPLAGMKVQADLEDQSRLASELVDETERLQVLRDRLGETMRKRQGLSKLREKRLKEHRVREEKRAQKEAEELFLVRKYRQRPAK